MHDSVIARAAAPASTSRARALVPHLPLAAALAFVLAGPAVLDLYTVNVLTRAFFVAMAAATVAVLWGGTGYLTFGQSAFFGIGAYGLAISFTQFDFGPLQALLGLGGTLAAAGLVAALVGWISFYPGSTPLYATVISLVLPIVLVQLLYSGGELTGSSSGLVGFFTFDLAPGDWFRIGGLALLALVGLAHLVLASDAGKVLAALRDNEMRCAYLGLDAPRIRILLLVIAAMFAAAAGFGYAGFGGIAAPENASFVFGTQLVVAVALGGRGSPAAGAVGAILIELASAYLSSSLPFVWELFVGLAFILTILLLPEGLFARPGRLFAGPRLAPILRASDPGPREADAMPDARRLVDVVDLSKRFGALQVLQGVTFGASAGELLSLVGPNGAGKSTLMKCLADGRERSGGSVAVLGHDIARLSPDRIVAFGLGRKFQMASVFESLTVAECLRIARARAERPSLLRARADLALPAAALRIVEMSGLAERLDVAARELSHGLKQALELAMVMALEPKVVLLDEPTAGLTRAERRQIGAILVDLCRSGGLCVLLVEHDLDFVKEISSRIIVLHQGRIALDGTAADVMASPLIEDIYSGSHAPAAAEGRA